MVTNDERREVARKLRKMQGCVGRDEDSPELTKWDDLAAIVLDPEQFRACMRLKNRDNRTQAIRSVIAGRLADLIEPGPRAEEIAARAYRAAADYIDWELGDTPRVMALRERADELERMAHERDAAMENHEPTPKCSEATPKCDTSATHTDTSATRDREALLELADEMSDYTWYETEGDHRIAEGFADRIRVALGATGGGRRVFVERLAPAVDSRCGAGASRLRGPGPRATGGRRP